MHMQAIWPGGTDFAGRSYLAVDFFFLLSGFVMARTYEARIVNGFGAYRFLRARILRLWPTMTVGALLALPFAWRDQPSIVTFLNIAIPNLLLLPTFAAASIFALNVPAWSIFFELLANAAHGLVLARLRSAGIGALAGCALAALAFAAWHFGNLDLGSRQVNAWGGLVRVAFSYMVGILLWRRFGDHPPVKIPPLAAFCAMPVLFSLPYWLAMPRMWWFDVAFVAICSPLILWGGLGLRRFTRMAVLSGAMSFPLYAVHYPLLLASESIGLSPASGVAVTVVGAAVLTWFSTRQITPPHINAQQNVQCDC